MIFLSLVGTWAAFTFSQICFFPYFFFFSVSMKATKLTYSPLQEEPVDSMNAVFAYLNSRTVHCPTQVCIRASEVAVFLENFWELTSGKFYLK